MGYFGRRLKGRTADWTSHAEDSAKGPSACPRCGFDFNRREGRDETAGEGSAALSARRALEKQIVGHLAAATFPIRNEEELRRAFGPVAEFDMAGIPLGGGALAGLLVPRDYLFTNPQQIASLVAARAAAEYAPERLQAFRLAHTEGAASRRLAGEPLPARERVTDPWPMLHGGVLESAASSSPGTRLGVRQGTA